MPAKPMNDEFHNLLDGLLTVVQDNLLQQGSFTLFAAAIDAKNDLNLFNIASSDTGEDVPSVALEPIAAKEKPKAVVQVWRDKQWDGVVKRLAKHVQTGDFIVCGLCSPSRLILQHDKDTMHEAVYCHVETRSGNVQRVVVPIVVKRKTLGFGDHIAISAAPCFFGEQRRA